MKLFCRFLNLLFPPRCIFCHEFIGISEDRICSNCRNSLPILCEPEKIRIFDDINVCYSLLPYENDVRQSLLRYKFGGLSFYSDEYVKLAVEYYDKKTFDCDVITWVPLSRKRLKSRGYDQAELIAKGLSLKTGVQCRKLLIKKRNVKPQSLTAGKEERSANIHGAYVFNHKENIAGRKVLLVDDIVTTGSTLSECAGVLKEAGAQTINAFTVARADK